MVAGAIYEFLDIRLIDRFSCAYSFLFPLVKESKCIFSAKGK